MSIIEICAKVEAATSRNAATALFGHHISLADVWRGQLRCCGWLIAEVWMCNCRTVVNVANRTAKPKAANKVSRRNRGLILRSVFKSPPIPKMGVPP